jgi:16S rRNA (cytosine967-C5)-methyltransferase
MLRQPRLFLRIRPGRRTHVLQQLQVQGIDYSEPFEDCLSLPNGTPVENWLTINRDVVVQDASSQQTGMAIRRLVPGVVPSWRLWDCCAASGGKSIMLHDLFGITDITVSDIRSSILHNLKTRFAQAGMPHPQLTVANLEEAPLNNHSQFDLVVTDVPCTGSGTWARTPEQLFYFDADQVQSFSKRQLAIAKHASKNLKPGGYFVYITCSVFAAENEEVINGLVQQTGMTLMLQKLINGVPLGADSMFIAVLTK